MKKKFSLKALLYISFSLAITSIMLTSAPIVAHAYISEFPTVTVSGAEDDELNGIYYPSKYYGSTYEHPSGARLRLVGFTWCLNPHMGGLAYFSNVYTSSTIPPETGWLKYWYTDEYTHENVGFVDPDFTVTYPVASLSQTTATVNESDGSVSVNVQLSEATSYETYVKYKTDNGTAQAGADFTGVSQAENKTVYIPPGQTSATINIPITNDSTYESSENFTVSIYGIYGGARIQTGSTTVTIENDDPFPAIGFASDSFSADEEGGSADIMFGLSNPSSNDVTVNYQTAGIGETGAAYTSESGTVTIPAGTTSASFAVHGLGELPETISVSLSSPSGAALGVYPSATVSILKTKAYFAQTAVSANETATGITLEVCLSDPAEDDIKIDYSTADGSAAAGEDYIAVAGTLTIPAGETSGLIEIPLVNDIVYEGEETFTVSLSNPIGTVLEDQTTATVSIVSDDPMPAVQFSAGTASVNENSDSVSLSVMLSRPSAFDLTVNYATANGTAKAGQDYTSQSGTLTIPKGATERYVTIPIINNNIYDSNRAFTVTLSSPSGAALGTPSSVAVTIVNDDPTPSVQFAESAVRVDETAGEVVVPVQFSHSSVSIMQVQVRTSNGSATAGQDYTALSSGYAVGSGSTGFNLRIPILNDNLYEVDETLYITLSSPSGCTLGEKTICTVTIASDELPYEMQFSPNSFTVNEDAGNAGLTVQLSRVSSTNTTVHYQTADITAKAGEDYTSKTGVLTIPAGDTSGTISIPILNDNIYEVNEDFAVTLYGPGGADGTILGAAAIATVTIVSEDAKPSIQFSTDSTTVSETAGAVFLTLQLSRPFYQDLWITCETPISGSAAAGQDYGYFDSPVLIPKGSTSASFSVLINDDNIYEGDESFSVVISSLDDGGPSPGSILTQTVTIVSDDPLPAVEFDSASASVNEDEGYAELNIRLSHPSAFDITVDYATADGSALTGDDYTAKSGTLTILKGDTEGLINIPILNDTIYEGNEAFTVALSNPSGASLGAQTSATVTIASDEPLPRMEFSASTENVNENSSSVIITISLSHPSAFDLTVDYVTADGTAAAGVDYTAKTGTLAISKGDTAGTVSIPVLNDNIYELNETFTVTLSSPSGAVLGGRSVCTVTIASEDAQPVMQYSTDSVTVAEDIGIVDLDIQLSHPSAFDITVNYETADSSAQAGEDYTTQTGILTIPKGITSGCISVPILNDNTYEGDETFTVTLSSSSGVVIGEKNTATVTIANEDLMPMVEFTANQAAIGEDDGSVTLFVWLSNPSAFDVKVDYETADGSALAAEDYTAEFGTLTIPKGTTVGSVSVSILEDTVYEGDETFAVTLSFPSDATLGITDRTVVTIVDAETVPSLEFSAGAVSVGEDDGGIELLLQLSHPSAFDISVDYATMDGSTLAGEDYTSASDTLTIPKGATAGSVTVSILEDNIYEGDEAFTVALSSPCGVVLGPQANSTVTIVSNDAEPSLGFYKDAYSINEDTGSVWLSVLISHPSAFDITVDFKTADGSATAGEDYTDKTGTLTIPKGDVSGLIEIPILQDTVYEEDETFNVTLGEPSGAGLGPEITATVTIVSEEKKPVTGFSVPAVFISEAASSAEILVNLSHLSAFDVKVNYETIDASGKAGEDYSAVSGTLVIPAGSISRPVSIPILPDSVYEGAEDFKVILSDASGAILGAYSITTVTIEEDDKPTITGVEENYKIYHGNRIILDPQPPGGTWDWDKTFFSATFNSPATFTALKTGTSTITYTVGGATQSITITILPAELPVTGQDFTWGCILLGLTVCTLVGAVFLKRQAHKERYERVVSRGGHEQRKKSPLTPC